MGLITVSCPNYADKLVNRLWNFFLSSHAVDYSVQCGGRSIKTHGLLLEVFLPREKLGRSCVIIQKPTEDDHQNNSCIGSLIEFLYKGQVTVPQDQLAHLSSVAKDLDFQILMEAVQSAATCTNNHLDNADKTLKHPKNVNIKSSSNVGMSTSSRSHSKVAQPQIAVVSKEDTKRVKKSKRKQPNVGMDTNNATLSHDVDIDNAESDITSPTSKRRLSCNNNSALNDNSLPEIEMSNKFDVTNTNFSSTTTAPNQNWPEQITDLIMETVTDEVTGDHSSSDHDHNDATYEASNRSDSDIDESGNDGDTLKDDSQIWDSQSKQIKVNVLNNETAKITDRPSTRQLRPRHKCDICGVEFSRLETLAGHAKIHVEEDQNDDDEFEPVNCSICGKVFKSEYLLVRHRRGYCSSKEFKCDDCGKEFKFRTVFNRHRRAHLSREKVHKCGFCSAAFDRPRFLFNHVIEQHPKEGMHENSGILYPYKCSYCPRTSSSIAQNTFHERTHTGEKPFKCTYEGCERKFIHPRLLDQHIKMLHTLERPYKCELCDKAFAFRRSWRNHMSTHDGNNIKGPMRPDGEFKCTFEGCSKSYARKNGLARHLKYNDHGGQTRTPETAGGDQAEILE